MTIFAETKGRLSLIDILPFQSEKEIHSITEFNLDVVFGLRLVKGEFPLGKFRLDTLAYDELINAFAVIEYKRSESFSVIDQGYAYLSLILEKKADLVLLFNQVMGKHNGVSDIDWTQSRVLFVCPTFTEYQQEAINFQDLPIELWRIQKYSNGTISYVRIKSFGETRSINIISKSKAIAKVNKEVKVTTQDRILASANPETREKFLGIKQLIYEINGDIEEKIRKTMIGYYSGGKGLIWVKPVNNRIILWLRKGHYVDRYGKINPSGWGGYAELSLKSDEIDLNYIKSLIEQASNKPA